MKTLLGTLLFCLACFDFVEAKVINITTFNVRWFGIGGEYTGTKADEFRDPWIKEFITKKLKKSDVILFQEILDIGRLGIIVAPDLRCQGYKHPHPRHQNVVLCFKNEWQFVPEANDDNYAIESLALDEQWSRPGLHGLLLDENEQPLVHIVGVHLKSSYQHTESRLFQTNAVAKELSKIKDGLPVIVLGDFNTHLAAITQKKADDVQLIDSIFSKHRLYRLPNDLNTFRIADIGLNLDHIWVSRGVEAVDPISVAPACNNPERGPIRFENPPFYYRFISDHCPVSATLRLNR